MVHNGRYQSKLDDLEVPPFWETSISMEYHGLSISVTWDCRIYLWVQWIIYPLENVYIIYITMESHHFLWVNQLVLLYYSLGQSQKIPWPRARAMRMQ